MLSNAYRFVTRWVSSLFFKRVNASFGKSVGSWSTVLRKRPNSVILRIESRPVIENTKFRQPISAIDSSLLDFQSCLSRVALQIVFLVSATPNNPLRPTYYASVRTHWSDEFEHRCRRNAIVMTPLPFSVIENLELCLACLYVGRFHQMYTDGYSLHGTTVTASFVTWLSLDGLNTGINVPVVRLLSVIVLARIWTQHSYTVSKTWVTSAIPSCYWNGCTIRETVSWTN